MKSCVPYGKYILAVFFIRKIPEILVFFMVNSMCSLCRIRYGNFFVFVVDGVPLSTRNNLLYSLSLSFEVQIKYLFS